MTHSSPTQKVAIARCAEYDKDKLKKEMLQCIRLVDFNLKELSGKKVLLKPNLLFPAPPEKQITTNPIFVRAIAEIALESGAKVSIGDSPAVAGTVRCLKASGLMDVLEGLPVQQIDFCTPIMVRTKGTPERNLVLSKEAIENDIIINLPKLKAHGQMYLTCSVKNMFGLMPGLSKGKMHLVSGTDNLDFAKMLVELCYIKKPALTLVDAIMAMDGNGPGSGSPYPLHIMMAGTDPMAIDLIASEIISFKREAIPIFKASEELSIGICDRNKIEVMGETIEAVKVNDFRPAVTSRGFNRIPAFIINPLKNNLSVRPYWEHNKCNLCKECMNICPVKCLEIKNKRIAINRNTCIRCLCCQEICPKGVISARRNLPGRIIERMLK